MSRVPGIHEIFSNQSKAKNCGVRLEEQEFKKQFDLSKKNDITSQIQKSKLGGYKPKILAGETNFLEREETPPLDQNATLIGQSRSNSQYSEDAVQNRPQLTNPKPWVIGDKNVPMVLGSVDDNEDNDNNNTEPHRESPSFAELATHGDSYYNNNDISGSTRPLSVSSETSTLVSQNSDSIKRGIDNPVIYANGFVAEDPSQSATYESDGNLRNPNMNIRASEILVDGEPEDVFIPAPDYDEDEKTLDFNSEDADDPNDGAEGGKHREVKPRTGVKVYEGADLSHFFSEDDAEQQVVLRGESKLRSKLGKKPKSEIQDTKLSEKHSIFKQSTNKSKRKNSEKTPTFNSVRSFSYADSKFGTKGKAMSKSLSFSEFTDDGELFLSTNSHQSSYESFLRSRHGDAIPPEPSSDGVDTRGFVQGPKLRQKDDSLLKKLTLRIKRMSKNLDTKEQ